MSSFRNLFDGFLNIYWGWMANSTVTGFYITPLIQVLKKYDKIIPIPTADNENELVLNTNNGEIIAFANEDTQTYDIFYKNLHFHVVEATDNQIFQIFLKTEDDAWVLTKDENDVFNVSSPITKKVEIFYWFDVETMHENRCSDEKYFKGMWNEYVFKTVNEFTDKVLNLTVEFQINDAYKNFKN